MKGRRIVASCLMILMLGLCVVEAGAAAFDFTGYDVTSANLEAVLGTKVAELDAKAYGFSFGAFDGVFRNLNIITQVFRTEQAVTIGTGENGTEIALEPGGYTFVYTLDYTTLSGGLPNSTVNDFQMFRLVDDQIINHISNPGEPMAFNKVLGGAYNTNAEFGGGSGTPSFELYPAGLTGTETIMVGFESYKLEYAWPNGGQVAPGTKAMVFLFTSPETHIWQLGWGSQNGQDLPTLAERQAVGLTGEGGNVVGGGGGVNGIPMYMPVAPEPACLLGLLFGGVGLLKKRR